MAQTAYAPKGRRVSRRLHVFFQTAGLRGLRLDPRLDALEDHAGFQALVERFDKR